VVSYAYQRKTPNTPTPSPKVPPVAAPANKVSKPRRRKRRARGTVTNGKAPAPKSSATVTTPSVASPNAVKDEAVAVERNAGAAADTPVVLSKVTSQTAAKSTGTSRTTRGVKVGARAESAITKAKPVSAAIQPAARNRRVRGGKRSNGKSDGGSNKPQPAVDADERQVES
jgi:ribosomal protein L32